MELYDKKGIPIKPGDVLKVFHFVAAVRREKMYMYKQAVRIIKAGKTGKHKYLYFSHLNFNEGEYYLYIDDSILSDYEIVQGDAGGINYRDRERKKV